MKTFTKTFILLLVLNTSQAIIQGQNSDIRTDKRILSSMAGEGDPWEVLNKKLEKILLALHKGYEIPEIASAFQMDETKLIKKLDLLVEANILVKTDSNYYPDILIATEDEAQKVYNHAIQTSNKISQATINNWKSIELTYGKLDISKSQSLNEIGFILVGSRILDVGVLSELSRNGELLQPAPLRPTPSYSGGRYYLWIVENTPDTLGYGQKDAELKFKNWDVINFGQDNASRFNLEEKAIDILVSGEYNSPEHFSILIGASFMNKEDSKLWDQCIKDISCICLQVLLEEKEEIRELYEDLKTSQYSENTFDDFYCWYYHFVYPLAINNLIENKLFVMPQDKHITIVSYSEKGYGVSE